MSKRQYTDKEKGAALAAVDFFKGNTREASKALGIPHTTLQDWIKNRGTNEDVTEIRTEKKREIAEKLEDLAHTLLDGMMRGLTEADGQPVAILAIKDATTSVGIAVDKMQLLKGNPTAITKDATARTHEERANRILELVAPRKAG